jgi:hypothetical protein
MKIAYFTLDAHHLTAAEVTYGDDAPWAFLPFEDQRADLDALTDRHVLLRGEKGAFAIVDAKAKERVLDVRAPEADRLRWWLAPRRRSVFVVERSFSGMLELPIDGGPARHHVLPSDFPVFTVAERDDGKLICGSRMGCMGIYDPDTGDLEQHPFEGYVQGWNGMRLLHPKWFSPNARLMLRPHVGSVIRDTGDGRGHPDLKADGVVRYGVAVDVYETGPIRHVTRLILQYLAGEELYPEVKRMPDGAWPPGMLASLGVLDALAEAQDYRRWDGVSQLLLTAWRDEDPQREQENKRLDEQVKHDLLDRVKQVSWADDSASFEVVLKGWRGGPALQRTVYLTGEVGEATPRDWSDWRARPPLPSESSFKKLKADISKRSVQRIAMPDVTSSSLLAACEEMARRVEGGLANVLFRDVLEFRFKLRGERTKGMDETAFFKLVRALPEQEWAAFVPPLRRLMESYGRQAIKHECTGNDWITGGGEPEDWRAALSEAALTLAEFDPNSFEVLRDWFQTDDQEHDNFPANSVFPAIARRSGFATPEAARFGVWFYIYQWQNVFFDRDGMGLLEACKRHWKAEQFALVAAEEARRVAEHEGPLPFGLADDPSETMLGQLVRGSSSWEIAARRALETHWPKSSV